MASEVTISVALVTRNRHAHLRSCLESWSSQTRQPFEIVVSDDSDGDEQSLTSQLATEFRCRYVAGPRRGLYANRNHAALACRGTHILTADDDHTHPTDYLESIHRLAQSDPERVWIFGERMPSQPDAPLLCPAELRPNGTFGPPFDPEFCAAIADGAALLPAFLFADGLRYDEAYRFGPLWYLFGKKIALAHRRIAFSQSTYVWHHCARSIERFNSSAQAECQLYVLAVNAFWLNANLAGWARFARAFAMALGPGLRILQSNSISHWSTRARITPRAAARALRLAFRWRGNPSSTP